MKIMKKTLIKENFPMDKNQEEDILQEHMEELPIEINDENPIEADKKIEIANSVKPADRDNITNIINDIEEHDISVDNIKEDNEILNKDLTTEQLKNILTLMGLKYGKSVYVATESNEVLKEEVKNLRENFNTDIFETIVQDLESMKNLFNNIIKLVNDREELSNNILRKLQNPNITEGIFKEYDLSSYMDIIGTIRNFSNKNNLESLLHTLLFFVSESTIDLTKEDNEIFKKLISHDLEKASSVSTDLLKRLKEDSYTAELNKKTTTPHTAYGSVLDKEYIEYMDSNDNFVIKKDRIESNIVLYNLNYDFDNFNSLLNNIKDILSNFQNDVIENMKILEAKYDNIISAVKSSIINFNNPSTTDINVLWNNLMIVRTFYITMMSKRLADRMSAHYVLMKILEELLP